MSTSFLLAVSERTNDSHNINTHVGSTDIVRGVLSEINGRAMVETVVSVSSDAQAGLLNVESLGTSLPSNAMHGADETSRPFACAVRIEIRGQTESQAVEQGSALVREVQASFARGRVPCTKRASPGSESCVMWENIGSSSIRLDPFCNQPRTRVSPCRRPALTDLSKSCHVSNAQLKVQPYQLAR